MNTETLILILCVIVFAIAYYLLSTKLNPKKTKKIFYTENKIDMYFPSFFRGIIWLLGFFLLMKIIGNGYIAVLLSILWFIAFIFLDLYFLTPKMLIIEDNKIRCPLHWEFNVVNLKEWYLDKEKKAISFTDKSNRKYHFYPIKDSDKEKLQEVLCNKLLT